GPGRGGGRPAETMAAGRVRCLLLPLASLGSRAAAPAPARGEDSPAHLRGLWAHRPAWGLPALGPLSDVRDVLAAPRGRAPAPAVPVPRDAPPLYERWSADSAAAAGPVPPPLPAPAPGPPGGPPRTAGAPPLPRC